MLADLADGGAFLVLCYNLPSPPSQAEPDAGYAARLRSAALKVGLPAEYVASLP